MDIVTRLRQFMELKKIPITQFADTCGIPRPTLSQLLNGRNKKVSDELISKIHYAYPSLSVLWLLFGDGDMMTDANIKTSEAQNGTEISFLRPEQPKEQADNEGGLFAEEFSENQSENSAAQPPHSLKQQQINFTDSENSTTEVGDSKERNNEATTTISFNNSKRIVNIIVVYSDTTVESFVPAK